MRTQEITTWTQELLTSFGGARAQVDREHLLKLYHQQDFTSMLAFVRKSLRLDIGLRVGYVNSGGPKDAPAWVNMPDTLPMFGTHAFRSTKITVYIRKISLEQMSFPAVVCMMAHELSHIVLDSIRHSLRRQEEAVDLTAMLLGYRDFFTEEMDVRTITILDSKPRSWFDKITNHRPIPEVEILYHKINMGYLNREERFFAASLMK